MRSRNKSYTAQFRFDFINGILKQNDTNYAWKLSYFLSRKLRISLSNK